MSECLTCEGAGVVTVNFSINSRGPCGIKRCPDCDDTREERDEMEAALAQIQKIAAREWAAHETNYEWYGDIAGIAEKALGMRIGGGS